MGNDIVLSFSWSSSKYFENYKAKRVHTFFQYSQDRHKFILLTVLPLAFSMRPIVVIVIVESRATRLHLITQLLKKTHKFLNLGKPIQFDKLTN